MDPLARINAAFGIYRSGPMLNGDGNAGGGGSGGGPAGGTGGGAGGGTAGPAGGTGGTAGSTQGAGGQGGGDGAGTGQSGSSNAGGTGGTRSFTQDELNTRLAEERRETERKVREQVQREAADASETERTEAARKAAEERGEYDTVKNGLISERDTLKTQVTERDNELKDLRTLAQQQFDDLTKDLPDTLKAMIPGDSTPLMKRIEAAKNARTYHDEQTGGSGGTGNQGAGGTRRGTGNDPRPNGDGGSDSGIKVGIGLFGRTNS